MERVRRGGASGESGESLCGGVVMVAGISGASEIVDVDVDTTSGSTGVEVVTDDVIGVVVVDEVELFLVDFFFLTTGFPVVGFDGVDFLRFRVVGGDDISTFVVCLTTGVDGGSGVTIEDDDFVTMMTSSFFSGGGVTLLTCWSSGGGVDTVFAGGVGVTFFDGDVFLVPLATPLDPAAELAPFVPAAPLARLLFG